jgi:cyclase
MDVKRLPPSQQIPSGYEMVIDGGRIFTGLDALAWAKEGERLGAGEICLNSIDADGTQKGYELRLTELIAANVNIPVIASGGAGAIEHIHEAFAKGMADAALIASITHYGTHTIKEIKSYLHEKGIKVRMTW